MVQWLRGLGQVWHGSLWVKSPLWPVTQFCVVYPAAFVGGLDWRLSRRLVCQCQPLPPRCNQVIHPETLPRVGLLPHPGSLPGV